MEATEKVYRQVGPISESLSESILAAQYEAKVDALDVLLVLTRRRWMILIFSLAGLLAGVALGMIMRPSFTARTTILPPQQQSSSAALLNQLGSLASLGGGASGLGLKTPADMYAGMLGSRTIADALIAKFRLQDVYKRTTLEDTRATLKKRTSIDVAKDGLIELAVTDHDANRASQIANGYIEELHELNSSLAIGEAAQRRLFFDRQMDGEKKALATAEDELQATQQKTGLIQMNGQAQAIIQSIEQLHADISSREVQLEALRSFATEQNPKVIRLQNEIAEMRSQLSKMESRGDQDARPGDIAVPTGSLPKDSLDYTRKLRAVKYHEALFDLLSKQEEAARIDEAKSSPIIQVVDTAVVPDRQSGPPKLLITLGLTIMGFVFGALLAMAEFTYGRLRQNPYQRTKIDNLRSVLRLC